MTDPSMGTWTYAYDLNGNLTRQTDARGVVLTFEYDKANRLTGRFNNGTPVAGYVYDIGSNNVGRRAWSWTPDATIHTVHTARGQVATAQKGIPAGSTAISIFEAEANTFHQAGSSNGSAWVSPPSGGMAYLTFGPYVAPAASHPNQVALFRLSINDAVANNDVVATVDVTVNLGQTVLASRQIRRGEFLGGISNFSEFALPFNATGHASSSLEFRVLWHGNAQLAHDRTTVAWLTPSQTSYAYDSADRVTSMTYPNGEVVTTGYNDAMEPVSLAGWSSYVSGATYNALGLLNGMNHGNTTATRYFFYGSDLEHTAAGNTSYGRLRRICVIASTNVNGCADDANAAGALFKMAYAYDAVGNITNQGDRTLGQGLAYAYDAQDRLVSWSLGGVTQETYSYDALGRMTNRSWLGAFSYGIGHRPYQVTAIPGGGIANYDANGNMGDRWNNNVWFHHEWNADNKVSRVHGNGHDIRYFYDPDGVLVRKVQNGVTTVYIGDHVEWTIGGLWTNYYTFNGRRIAMRNGAGVFWLHGDHLGSASLSTNSSGGTHSQVRYGPFGSERWTNGTMPTAYKFTNQRAEDSVGLYDYDARMYSPLLARFISPDSIVPDMGNVQDWNRYAYVRHNPMIHTDPSGHVLIVPLLIKGAMLLAKAAPMAAMSAAAVVHKASPTVHRAMATAQRVASHPVMQDVAGDAAIGAGGELLQSYMIGKTASPMDVAKGAVAGVISNGMYRGATKNMADDYRPGALLHKSFHASASAGVAELATESAATVMSGKSLDSASVGNALGNALAISYIGPINPAVSRIAKFFGSKNELLNDAAGEFATRTLFSAFQNNSTSKPMQRE